MNRQTKTQILFAIFVSSLIAVALTIHQSHSVAQTEQVKASNSLPLMSLTVVALNGTEIILDENDIAALPSHEARGGYKTSLGSIRGLDNYTGVLLSTLCDLVGGINETSKVNVTASDGYFIVCNYSQLNGNFTTYNTTTGDPVQQTQPLNLVLAYYKNDTELSEEDGPLKLVIVGPEGLVTDSIYWVKQVVKIELLNEPIPEFQPYMILPLFAILTLVVATIHRKRTRNTQA